MQSEISLQGSSVRTIKSLIRLMRPIQWSKNIFVFAGVIFSKSFDDPIVFITACLTALSFCFVSSTVYIVNDITDRESDRHHPKKKNRPVASGEVSVSTAWTLSLFTATVGGILAILVSYKVLLIVLSYVFLNILYSIRLKHVVILDVFCIAAGFMLRIMAGTVGLEIPPSKWVVLCGLMITLFLGFTKRRAELASLQDGAKGRHRHVLNLYKTSFLDGVITICATSVIITYSLYTMSPATVEIHQTDDLIFTVPFVIYALFRYIFNLQHSNTAGDPSTDLFRDKHILAAVIGWIFTSIYFISYRGI